eukprot:m.146925 g.146925  ORF g.146925 m.146925 type:complete len:51 (+) comp11651_c2_seq17:71-223(+)
MAGVGAVVGPLPQGATPSLDPVTAAALNGTDIDAIFRAEVGRIHPCAVPC